MNDLYKIASFCSSEKFWILIRRKLFIKEFNRKYENISEKIVKQLENRLFKETDGQIRKFQEFLILE